jgi:tetratricopeptide (TPR) repeat protein
MNVSHQPNRGRRIVRALSITAVLALGATACSGVDDSKSSDSSSSASPDAKKAKTALDAGLKAHAAGDLTTAAADYKETLKYDSKNKFAYYNLALIDEAAGNYGLAEQKYRAALKSDPAYEPALFNLAILRTSRDPEEAIGLYKKAVAANPKDAAAWLNLGLLLRAAGQEREGDKDVLRAIGLNPDLKDPKAAG